MLPAPPRCGREGVSALHEVGSKALGKNFCLQDSGSEELGESERDIHQPSRRRCLGRRRGLRGLFRRRYSWGRNEINR